VPERKTQGGGKAQLRVGEKVVKAEIGKGGRPRKFGAAALRKKKEVRERKTRKKAIGTPPRVVRARRGVSP